MSAASRCAAAAAAMPVAVDAAPAVMTSAAISSAVDTAVALLLRRQEEYREEIALLKVENAALKARLLSQQPWSGAAAVSPPQAYYNPWMTQRPV